MLELWQFTPIRVSAKSRSDEVAATAADVNGRTFTATPSHQRCRSATPFPPALSYRYHHPTSAVVALPLPTSAVISMRSFVMNWNAVY